VHGLDAVRSSPGVLAADLYFGAGATIRPVQVDADRSGYVVATAPGSVEALALADAAAEKLDVHVAGDAAPARRRRRMIMSAVLAGAIVVATVLGFVLTDGSKLGRSLIATTHVSKRFSPGCRCRNDVAQIAFRLLQSEPVTFRIVDASGRTVATLVNNRLLPRGEEHFHWHGRNARGHVLPSGDYRPEVTFDSLHQTVVLDGPIVLVG
jgi:hypothetical protein